MGIKICAIAAMDSGRVIGNAGGIPWHIPEDMKHFSRLTRGHTVLMGRKTYQSLPDRFRPLPERKNLVISRGASADAFFPGAEIWNDPKECIEAYRNGRAEIQGQYLWIIGGEQIYRQTVAWWDEVYLTRVLGNNEGDAFFPAFEDQFELLSEERHQGFIFEQYQRKG